MMLPLLLASTVFCAQALSPEQTAFNYFATVLVAQYYPQAKYLFLSGQSEATAPSKGPFGECFPDGEFRVFWAVYRPVAGPAVPVAYHQFPVFKRATTHSTKQLQVRLYRAFVGPGGTYTYVTVSKSGHFTDHYLLKVSDLAPGEVRVCRQAETW